jgi:hypothetical protein
LRLDEFPLRAAISIKNRAIQVGQFKPAALKAMGPNFDGAEKNGKPSQLAIAVEGANIYWVDSKFRFRLGEIR